MRILYDHQIIDSQSHGGVSRYFFELTSALQKNGLVEVRFPKIRTHNTYFHPDTEKKTGAPGLLGRITGSVERRLRSGTNERASIKELKGGDFDVFHPIYYDPYFLGHLNGKPFVLTIYDMIHEIYPQYFDPNDVTSKNKALLAEAATKIIAISSSTKADIIKYLHIDPKKIEVVYLANSLAPEVEKVLVPERYILYVGGRGRYKNFNAFFTAFSRFAVSFPDVALVCASYKPFMRQELDLIERSRLGDRCINIKANDEELAFLYRNAISFFYPSLYEGFGLPILEAFSCDCPVALSETSCFPEIAGDAALYFDPSDISSMEGALRKMVSENALRQSLVRNGQKRLGDFSWEKTAQETARVYNGCIIIKPTANITP